MALTFQRDVPDFDENASFIFPLVYVPEVENYEIKSNMFYYKFFLAVLV